MKISSIALGVLLAASLCGPASAAETTYGVGTRALPLQQSGGTARAMSMGSAVVAVEQGSASLLWNPAGLSKMDCKEFSLHHNSGLGDTMQEIFVFGMPLGEVKDGCKGGSMGGIAASLGYVNYGSFAGADALGQQSGTYNSGDYSASLGWGMELFRNVSAGIVLKGNRSTFDTHSYNTLAADVGMLWNATRDLDLGISYSNFGTKVGDSGLTSGVRLGAGYKVNKHWLLAASGELQNKAMNRAQFGTEYQIGDVDGKANVLALRGGYQLSFPDRELDTMAGLTWGLGYTLTRAIAVDYAMLPTGDLGISHRVSLTFKFGCPAKEKAAAVTAAAVVPVAVATETVTLRTIALEDSHFTLDSVKLKPAGMKALNESIQLMKKNPNARMRVAGYTSLSGTAEYSQRLSERRAFAVRDYMVNDAGIPQSWITVIGYGEARARKYDRNSANVDAKGAKSNMRALFNIAVK